MKKALILTAVVCIAITLISCAGTKGIKITDKNKDSILQTVTQSKSLTQEEKQLVTAYLMRSKLGGLFGIAPANPVGKTIGQIIDEQKAYMAKEKLKEEQEKLLAKQAKAKEEAMVAELRKAVTLTVYEKGYLPSNYDAGRYEDYITIKVAYQNTSSKAIRAFQGTVIFQDLFGDVVYKSGLKITDSIAAGQKATWDGSITYNKFDDEMKRFLNTDLKDMKVVWAPKTIIFEDGTKIGEGAGDS